MEEILPGGSFKRSWSLIKGTYKRNNGSWIVKPWGPSGSESLLIYAIDLDPDTSVPDFIIRKAQTSTLPDLFEAIRRRVRSLHRLCVVAAYTVRAVRDKPSLSRGRPIIIHFALQSVRTLCCGEDVGRKRGVSVVGIQANVVMLWVIIIALLGGWGCGAESDLATEDKDVLADTSEVSSPSGESAAGSSEQDAPQLVMDAPMLLDGEDAESTNVWSRTPTLPR